MRITVALFSIWLCLSADAATWYASPTQTPGSGDGSIGNPWTLYAALKKTNIVAGDTLYLRGGTYVGPGFRSNLTGTSTNYVTVGSYPGEWAVVTDGNVQHLTADVANGIAGNSTFHVPISNSADWSTGMNILIDGETLNLFIKEATPGQWTVTRGWNGTTPSAHTNGAPVYLQQDDFIFHTGSYCTFRDFEIKSSLTSRVVDSSGVINTNWSGYTNWLGSGLNLQVPGVGNKAINLIVHDTGHPGIGLWSQKTGGEINGCVIWGCGYYDLSPSYHELRGSGIYTQNPSNNVYIVNSYVGKNLTEGMHVYGQDVPPTGYRLIKNLLIGNNNGSGILVGPASFTPASDDALWTNLFGINNFTVGYTGHSNTFMSVVGNVMMNGSGVGIVHHISGVFTNNTLFYDGSRFPGVGILSFSCSESSFAGLSFTWDWNAYYPKVNTYLFGFSCADVTGHAHDGTGKMFFAGDGTNNWSNWTGWDLHSTYAAGWPSTNIQMITQYDYDTNRWHIGVVNTVAATNSTVNLASLGFGSGDTYNLRDLQNYFTVIATGTGNGTLNLPLNLTNYSVVMGESTNVGGVNFHSNQSFPGQANAFLLTRIPGADLGTNYTVTVTSTPNLGGVVAASPVDNFGLTNGITTTSFTYTNGISVTLTAPAQIANSNFSKWQTNSVDAGTSTNLTMTVSTNITATAVYAPFGTSISGASLSGAKL